mmetsp:Transcript_29355/g.57637  ORF Transcript_29355/g.57637 Transcript_29355/m.57637 type:complete len:220 (-) Transcript_29355:129-788(-)
MPQVPLICQHLPPRHRVVHISGNGNPQTFVAALYVLTHSNKVKRVFSHFHFPTLQHSNVKGLVHNVPHPKHGPFEGFNVVGLSTPRGLLYHVHHPQSHREGVAQLMTEPLVHLLHCRETLGQLNLVRDADRDGNKGTLDGHVCAQVCLVEKRKERGHGEVQKNVSDAVAMQHGCAGRERQAEMNAHIGFAHGKQSSWCCTKEGQKCPDQHSLRPPLPNR